MTEEQEKLKEQELRIGIDLPFVDKTPPSKEEIDEFIDTFNRKFLMNFSLESTIKLTFWERIKLLFTGKFYFKVNVDFDQKGGIIRQTFASGDNLQELRTLAEKDFNSQPKNANYD